VLGVLVRATGGASNRPRADPWGDFSGLDTAELAAAVDAKNEEKIWRQIDTYTNRGRSIFRWSFRESVEPGRAPFDHLGSAAFLAPNVAAESAKDSRAPSPTEAPRTATGVPVLKVRGR